MKNSELINIFLSSDKEAKTKNVFIERNVIYSYGYHFPMAIKLNDGFFLLNPAKYSNTTSRHMYYLKNGIPEDKKIFCLNTQEIKHFVNLGFKTLQEYTMYKLKSSEEK